MSILETRNLRKIYGSGDTEVRALDGVNLSVDSGEFVAIVGTSGSGKSTLLHMLGGLDRPTSGSVIVDGKDIFSLKDEALTIFRRRKIGFVFQSYNLVPVLNVRENIVLPIQLDGRQVDEDFLDKIVNTLGLEKKPGSLPSQLSGGQQQRVAIARALASEAPVILAADRLMPTDLFSVPSGMILGIITAEGSGQSHAAIIARAMNIPGLVQVGRDFLDDCDGRTVILDATKGECTLDPDAVVRQQAETRICELQRENAEMQRLSALPNRTKNGQPFELLANCFGPEDIDTAMQSGARGVGLLRSSYMMLPGRILDEQEQYFFYCSCLAAAKGCPVTVRTFDFGADRTMADAYQGLQSSKLGLRGIRNSLRQPRQFETQLCALLRAAARGPLRVMFPMVTTVEDWDAAMRVVERCRDHLKERGVPFNEDTKFGVMLSVPAACLTAEEFVEHGVDFLVIGTNDLTQYTHAADRELASAEHYYRPASKAMQKLITMVMDAAKVRNVPVTICGLAVGNPANTVQYLQLGLRSFSVSPQNLLGTKKALLEAET